VTDITTELTRALATYNAHTRAGIAKAVTETGTAALKQVRAASPVQTGKYRRGWRMETKSEGGTVSVTISNKRYQLTHLLEHGHRTKNRRGFVAARPHIADAQEYAEREAMRRITEVIADDT
jgi:hypothetical protein